jgi:hypothetical protein
VFSEEMWDMSSPRRRGVWVRGPWKLKRKSVTDAGEGRDRDRKRDRRRDVKRHWEAKK